MNAESKLQFVCVCHLSTHLDELVITTRTFKHRTVTGVYSKMTSAPQTQQEFNKTPMTFATGPFIFTLALVTLGRRKQEGIMG